MKINIFSIIFYECLYLSFSFVPMWNFEKSAIKIFDDPYYKSYIYYPCNKVINGKRIRMKNIIKIESNKIIYNNVLYVDEENLYTENFTDVESVYYIVENEKRFYYVCPKGKFHLHRYVNYNNFDILKPDDFKEDNDWELKCYYHPNEHFLFVAYLKSNYDFYQYDLKNEQWIEHKPIYNGIFDFKWNTNVISNNKKQMFAILNKENQISLNELHFDISDGQNFDFSSENEIILTGLKTNYSAFFSDNNENHHFYWINYNSTHYDSGYYNETNKITTENFNEIKIINNTDKSPLEFNEKKINIDEIKFIPYTKYVYYTIYVEDKRVYYHGIIDIVQNKVIFNTDENIKYFFPLSNNSMFAFTDKDYYKICLFKNDSNDCTDTCPNGEIPIYDSINGNRCGTECNTKYILKPQNICINECDEDIYTINGNECGYCKDIDQNNNIYKLYKYKGCINKKPVGSYYINKKINLIACEDGVEYKDGKCGEYKCYNNCDECTEESTDPNNQKCTSCKENFVLYGENCIDKCPDEYFEKDKKCEKCSDSCKLCESNENHCISCNDGKYLEQNECKDCHKDCDTCSKGEENNKHNCLSCKIGKYLYIDTCYNDCPENTTKKDNKCIENKINNIDENEPTILYIFIIITAIVLILIIVFFFMKFCRVNKDEQIVNQIYTELS